MIRFLSALLMVNSMYGIEATDYSSTDDDGNVTTIIQLYGPDIKPQVLRITITFIDGAGDQRTMSETIFKPRNNSIWLREVTFNTGKALLKGVKVEEFKPTVVFDKRF